MATPRKRDREEEDDNEEESSPSLWNSVVGLFSTAKKKPKRQRIVESSTPPAAHLPRLNLTPAHVSHPAEANRTPPAPLAATTIPARTPAPARLAAPSPWQAAPIKFSPGPLVLTTSRRHPTRYRPMSRTLVPGRRRRTRRTEWNAELAARVLEQSQGLFRPQENGYTTTLNVVGTNQRGSRLQSQGLFRPQQNGYTTTLNVVEMNQLGSRLAEPARKQVSFEERPTGVRFQEPSQVATTPRVPHRTTQQRVTTPYVAARPAEPTESPRDDIEEEVEPLPLDYAAMPRPKVARDSEFVFNYPEEELGDPSRGTLVAFTKPIRTLSVTSIPPALGRDPRDVFQLLQEGPEEAQAPEVEEAPPVEESPTDKHDDPNPSKKHRPEGWGNLFAKERPGWKCDSCLVKNEVDAAKCVSCEEPRPGTGTASGDGGSATADDGGASGGGSAAGGGAAKGGRSNGAAAPSAFGGSIGTGGFMFGVGEESKGGFKFGTGEGGFPFGKSDKSLAEDPKPTGFSFPKPKETKEDVPKSESEKEDAPETPAAPFSFGIKPPAKSVPSKISFGVTPAAEPATEGKRPSGGFHFGAKAETGESATKKFEFSKPAETEKEETSTAPGFSLDAADAAATNSMGPPLNKRFNFGTATPATDDSAKFSFFSGGPTATPSAPPVTTEAPTTFGSAPSSRTSALALASSEDDGRKKKRRSAPDDDEEEDEESTSTQPFVFGATPAPAPAAGMSSLGVPAFSDTQGGAATFGSTPARSGDVPRFGTTPAHATAQPSFTFGSTPAATTPVAPSFGAPANADPAPSTGGFGPNGGSNPFGTNTAPSFGPSATTPAPVASVFNFGTSTAAPVAPTFGTPAPPLNQGFLLASTQAASSVAPFGATVARAPATGGINFFDTPPGIELVCASSPTSMTPLFGEPTTGTTPAWKPGFDGFGGFGATPGTGGFGATPGTGAFGATPGTGGFGATSGTPPIAPAEGGFSIGSGGGGGRSGAFTGRRRIIKARRPPGSGTGR